MCEVLADVNDAFFGKGAAAIWHKLFCKTKQLAKLASCDVAGVEGFEPSQAVLETDVLPLTLYPY